VRSKFEKIPVGLGTAGPWFFEKVSCGKWVGMNSHSIQNSIVWRGVLHEQKYFCAGQDGIAIRLGDSWTEAHAESRQK